MLISFQGSYRWFSARPPYLQGDSNGDTAVSRWAINIYLASFQYKDRFSMYRISITKTGWSVKPSYHYNGNSYTDETASSYWNQPWLCNTWYWLQGASLTNFVLTLGASLTHWGRVTHICVSKLTIIGSDNGLSPAGAMPLSEPMLEYCQFEP